MSALNKIKQDILLAVTQHTSCKTLKAENLHLSPHPVGYNPVHKQQWLSLSIIQSF